MGAFFLRLETWAATTELTIRVNLHEVSSMVPDDVVPAIVECRDPTLFKKLLSLIDHSRDRHRGPLHACENRCSSI